MGKKWKLKEHMIEDETTLFIFKEDILTAGVTLSKLELKELISDLLNCLKLSISRVKK